jgi:hypothetical protein
MSWPACSALLFDFNACCGCTMCDSCTLARLLLPSAPNRICSSANSYRVNMGVSSPLTLVGRHCVDIFLNATVVRVDLFCLWFVPCGLFSTLHLELHLGRDSFPSIFLSFFFLTFHSRRSIHGVCMRNDLVPLKNASLRAFALDSCCQAPDMAQRQASTRAPQGGAKVCQFKLVLLGELFGDSFAV